MFTGSSATPTPTVGVSDAASTLNMAGAATVMPRTDASSVDRNQLYEWILQLSNSKTREAALLELRYTYKAHRISFGDCRDTYCDEISRSRHVPILILLLVRKGKQFLISLLCYGILLEPLQLYCRKLLAFIRQLTHQYLRYVK